MEKLKNFSLKIRYYFPIIITENKRVKKLWLSIR
jgi:hypothetical protein